jgi:hypothetical protein
MRAKHIVWAAALALGGCATYSTSDKLEATQAQVQAAEAVGTRNVPPANYHVQRAKEESEFARGQLKRGNKKGADSTLDRTTADTDLAVQLVREEQSRQETRKVAEQMRQLMQKKGETP